jgi:hypothetical protein
MNLLNQRCKIERATVTKDAYRNTVKSWSTISTSAKCNIQYQSMTTNNLDQNDTGLMVSGYYLGFYDKDQNIQKGDKITWNGIELFVKGIPSPVFGRSNKIHHIETLLSVEET